ncbi:MAG: transcription antitermination factor NusB [Actinobacteria bacterium]|nr:MAG: transcription antitermination factor NusB [Actinomycetota bacterium]
MKERRKARRATLEIMYQSEVAGIPVARILKDRLFWRGELPEFSLTLLNGVVSHQDRIDALIRDSTDNWVLERMSIVDRNILRMAIYEMLYEEDIPSTVSVNEAVELAKVYGTQDSGKFVNGVLGRVVHDMEEEASQSKKEERREPRTRET